METTTAPTLFMERTTRKVLQWETNFNNKLGCDGMIHIDLAPRTNPTHNQMDNTILEIHTKDGSHEPVEYALTGLLVFPFEKICWQQSYPSHGMEMEQLANFFFERYGTAFSWKTPVAIYYFLKKK